MRDLPSRYSEKQRNSGHSVSNCQLQPKACNPRTQRLFDQNPLNNQFTEFSSCTITMSVSLSPYLHLRSCLEDSLGVGPSSGILRAQELDFEGPMAHKGLKFFETNISSNRVV